MKEKNNEQAVFALAAYFTGSNVGHYSIALGVPGRMQEQAKRFFEVRKAIGINGYMNISEAKEAIRRTLEYSTD